MCIATKSNNIYVSLSAVFPAFQYTMVFLLSDKVDRQNWKQRGRTRKERTTMRFSWWEEFCNKRQIAEPDIENRKEPITTLHNLLLPSVWQCHCVQFSNNRARYSCCCSNWLGCSSRLWLMVEMTFIIVVPNNARPRHGRYLRAAIDFWPGLWANPLGEEIRVTAAMCQRSRAAIWKCSTVLER